MATHLKDEFRNTTKGFIGVITLDNGKERGIAVRPGASIWLSEEEQILTANAPRRDEDNPFTNGQLVLETRAADVKNRRVIGSQQDINNSPIGDDTPDAAEQQVAPPEPEVVVPEPQTARQREDLERKKAEAKRQAEAKAQAEAGAIPAKATGAEVTTTGLPKVAGTRQEGEEVGDPAAPAAPAPEPAEVKA